MPSFGGLTAEWADTPRTSVLLTVTSHPDGPVPIMRTDRNGTHPVRGVPDAIAGSTTVLDHEPALTGAVTYTVTGVSVTLDELPARPAGAVLQRVGEPGSALDVTVITDTASSWETGATLHEVLDRADPAVILHPQRTRTGTLQLLTRGAAAAVALARLADGALLQLRAACPDLAPLDAYLLVTSARAAPITEHALGAEWRVELDYRVTGYPAGGTAGAGWTYAAVAATFADYAAVAATYRTYRDLVIGPA